MSRFARRQDDNHGAILEAFRLHGGKVTDTSHVGGGYPDVEVFVEAFTGPVWLRVEIKDGSKPPSARRLTPAQVAFREAHPWVRILEVLCVEDVARLMRNLKNPLARES